MSIDTMSSGALVVLFSGIKFSTLKVCLPTPLLPNMKKILVALLLLAAAVSASAQLQNSNAPAVPAAAPSLTIAPVTWGVVGLDSNKVTDGPNIYSVGARVCNVGNAPATNLQSTFAWDTANGLINLRTGSNATMSVASLAAGTCTNTFADLYYEVEITRSAAAYNTNRKFHISVVADGLSPVNTVTRELYVEKLVSQNRNSVAGIKLNGVNVPLGGTMTLGVGNTYTIELDGATATNGYEQLESFINLPNVIFKTLGVTSSYSAPTGYAGNKLYEDSCGWDADPASVTYRSCIGPQNVSGGKAGGTVTLIYTVKVLSGAGTSQTLNTLIYDFSGSSYHYNSDFSTSFVTARIVGPSAARVPVTGRILTADGAGIRNARVELWDDMGNVLTAKSTAFGYYSFPQVEAGHAYVAMVSSRNFVFIPASRFVNLSSAMSDLDFTATAPSTPLMRNLVTSSAMQGSTPSLNFQPVLRQVIVNSNGDDDKKDKAEKVRD